MTTQVLLPIPDRVYAQAQALAETQNRDVADVLSQVLLWNTTALATKPAMTEQEKREEAAFIRLHPQLRLQYDDQFVAIHNEQLVDHDTNLRNLHNRIIEKYGRQFVWISCVGEKPIQTLMVYSNRLEPG